MVPYKRFGAFSSSVNPQELAATVEGIIKAVAGLAVTMGVLTMTDASTVTDSISSIIQQITLMVSAGYAVYGLAQSVFGILRKVVVALSARF
jgi:hypothetical protein